MNFRDSFDTRILRWSGLAVIAFLAAAFALNSRHVSFSDADHAAYASRRPHQHHTAVR